MRRSFLSYLFCGLLLATVAVSASLGDDNEEAVKHDRKLYEGTWKAIALEIQGNKSMDEDVKKISVVNGSDNTWSLRVDGKEISKGTNTIYPTQKPKTIDFKPTEGEGKDQVYLGIYEIDEKTRKLCFAPAGKPRPTEFSSTADNQHIIVTFERDKVK